MVLPECNALYVTVLDTQIQPFVFFWSFDAGHLLSEAGIPRRDAVRSLSTLYTPNSRPSIVNFLPDARTTTRGRGADVGLNRKVSPS